MPRDIDDPASTNTSRIRENQRRSRARKREYVQSLESRLQHYHESEIKANVRIQEAARKVARENIVLRELLYEHGMSHQDIDTYVSKRSRIYNEVPLSSSSDASSTPGPAVHSSDSSERSDLNNSPRNLAVPCGDPINSLADIDNTAFQNAPALHSLDTYMSALLPQPIEPCSSICPCPPTASPILPSEKLSSTSCNVAFQLLHSLNSQRAQKLDIFWITLDLWDGYRAPSVDDIDGCSVMNDVLMPVVKRLLCEP